VKALIERASFDRFAAWGPMLVAICSNSQPLFFQAVNRGPQPTPDHFFDLTLIAVPIEGIQRFTGCVEWDVATGDFRGAEFGWH
jgi:hypothetical protein